MRASIAFALLFIAAACGAPTPAASPAPVTSDAARATTLSPKTTLTLLHTNDVHSRIDPVAQAGGHDLGGVVRRKAAIDRIRKERGEDHVLLVDAGDFSVGTIYFAVWKGSESIMAMNALEYDAVTLGNHEFDLGPAGLARTLRGGPLTVNGEARPTEPFAAKVVVSNLDVSKEDTLRERIVPRAVISRGGTRYGIVGAVTEALADFSSPGPTLKVLPYVESVQAQVDALTADGVDKIVLLSHCGSDVDTANAAKLSGVDVIVAAHDHALFGDRDALRGQGLALDVSSHFKGAYPRVVKGKDGQTVLIVSAYEWGRVLGRLDVTFDGAGHVEEGSWRGGPIVLADDVKGDPAFEAKVETYRVPAMAVGAEVVGTTAHALTKATSGQSELGALFADAELAAAKSSGAVVAFAEGDARADLAAGRVTLSQLVDVWPYESQLIVLDLTGEELERAVAHGLALEPPVQLAGITARVTRTADAKPAVRVVALTVGGRPVSKTAHYKVVVNDYVAKGGDGYSMLKEAAAREGGARTVGVTLRDAIARELHAHSPAAPKVAGRVAADPSFEPSPH